MSEAEAEAEPEVATLPDAEEEDDAGAEEDDAGAVDWEERTGQQQQKIEELVEEANELRENLEKEKQEANELREQAATQDERITELEGQRDADLGSMTDELREDLDEMRRNLEEMQDELDGKDQLLLAEKADHDETRRSVGSLTEEAARLRKAKEKDQMEITSQISKVKAKQVGPPAHGSRSRCRRRRCPRPPAHRSCLPAERDQQAEVVPVQGEEGPAVKD